MNNNCELLINDDFLDFATSYNNKHAIMNANALLKEFISRSLPLYKNNKVKQDIRYGKDERQRLDWFSTNKKAKGTVIFIHGGYWQHCNKEDYAFIAGPLLENGFDVILLEYTLAPACSFTRITQQIGEALDFIQHQLAVPQPVHLSGHSAGGHLTACWQQHSLITTSFPISGLFELSSLRNVLIGTNIQFTDEEIALFSPLRHVDKLQPSHSKSTIVIYGGYELYEMVNQSRVYHHALKRKNYKTGCINVPGTNHFTVLEHLFSSDGDIIRILNQ